MKKRILVSCLSLVLALIQVLGVPKMALAETTPVSFTITVINLPSESVFSTPENPKPLDSWTLRSVCTCECCDGCVSNPTAPGTYATISQDCGIDGVACFQWISIDLYDSKKPIECQDTIEQCFYIVQLIDGGTYTINWNDGADVGPKAIPLSKLKQSAATGSPTGLSPAQVKTAYNLPSTGGANTTIAIITAYDNPNVLADLNAFSKAFGLSSPNLEKHMMAASIASDSVWGLETSLDVQWAHAIAPDAKILLVEAKSNTLPDLMAAVDYARGRSDVVAVSMSWGSKEFFGDFTYNTHFTSAYGATFFASSGDSGTGVVWPATSPNVVAVGGTTLNLNKDGSVASETGWNGSGGGVSTVQPEPAYQSTYKVPGANGHRVVPDVSFNADPNTGYSVYDSFGYGGWLVVGGTSAGAPQWAAIQALNRTANNANFYAKAGSAGYASAFRDILTGSNGFTAAPGYDFVTGLGSPITTNFSLADFTLIAVTPAQTISGKLSASYTIALTALNGYNSPVSLAVTGLPNSAKAAFSLSSITPTTTGASSILTVTVNNGKPGTYSLTITAKGASLSHTASVTLVVQ